MKASLEQEASTIKLPDTAVNAQLLNAMEKQDLLYLILLFNKSQ